MTAAFARPLTFYCMFYAVYWRPCISFVASGRQSGLILAQTRTNALLIYGQHLRRSTTATTCLDMAKKKQKFYAVAVGQTTGVFNTWAECQSQVEGFRGAKFKSFPSRQEALDFVEANTPKTTEERPAKKARPTLYPRVSIEVHFDGGSRGNPGASGAGAVVDIVTDLQNGSSAKEQVKIRKYLGTNSTNNYAEYQGLLCGLSEAKEVVKTRAPASVVVKVLGDSDLIVQQMNGTYQCNSGNLKPLMEQAKSLVHDLESLVPAEISFEHVYREDNSIADALANEAIDTGRSYTSRTTTAESNDNHDRTRRHVDESHPNSVPETTLTDTRDV